MPLGPHPTVARIPPAARNTHVPNGRATIGQSLGGGAPGGTGISIAATPNAAAQGDFVVVAFAWAVGTTALSTVTDTSGNTWNVVSTPAAANQSGGYAYTTVTTGWASGANTVTGTLASGAPGGRVWVAVGIPGLYTPIFDQHNEGNSLGNVSITTTSGLAQAAEAVFVISVDRESNGSIPPTFGWTNNFVGLSYMTGSGTLNSAVAIGEYDNSGSGTAAVTGGFISTTSAGSNGFGILAVKYTIPVPTAAPTATAAASAPVPTVTADSRVTAPVAAASANNPPLGTYQAAVLADSPAGYWRLGDASGTSAADSGPNGLTGTYINAPALAQPSLTVKPGDTAATFSAASTQRVDVADNNLLDLGDVWTTEAWVKTTTAGTNSGIVSKGSGAYYMRMNTANQLEILRSFTLNLARSSVTINDGLPHHCVATKNGGTVKIYVDAIDVTVAEGSSTCVDNASSLCIGADRAGAAEYMTGTIDEVAVYPTALTAAQVSNHYNLGRSAAALQLSVPPPAATAAASSPIPTVAAAATVSPPAATATASAPTPIPQLAVPPAAATAAASAPTPTPNLTVPPAAATASASALTPGVTGGAGNQTVSPPVTGASASAPTPTIQISIPTPAATASASSPTSTLQLRLSPAPATASASALAPSVVANQTINVPAATASASSPLPTVRLVVSPPVANATANAFIPAISTPTVAPWPPLTRRTGGTGSSTNRRGGVGSDAETSGVGDSGRRTGG